MTATGHEAVKADLVTHLSDNLPAWMVVVRGSDTWPPDPVMVAATEMLPIDEDKPWPCVLVSTTAMTTSTFDGGAATVCDYDVRITVAVRTSKSKGVDAAVAGRDRMVQAVRWLLFAHPQAGDCRVNVAELSEKTDPVGLDPKSRPVAVGVTSVTVRRVESVPDLDAVVADLATVVIDAVDADGTL